MWRTGSKVPINVYEDDVPVCQCQTVSYARRIVQALNALELISHRFDSLEILPDLPPLTDEELLAAERWCYTSVQARLLAEVRRSRRK
jgi:hypothetical protein